PGLAALRWTPAGWSSPVRSHPARWEFLVRLARAWDAVPRGRVGLRGKATAVFRLEFASSKGVAMKATIPCLGAVLWAGLAAAPAPAQYAVPVTYLAPALRYPLPPAPDACGPGFYQTCPYGTTYGPNYCLRPCF